MTSPDLELDAAMDRDAAIALLPILLGTALGMLVEGGSHLLTEIDPGHRGWAPLLLAGVLVILALQRKRLPGRQSWWLLAPWLAIFASTLQHVDSAPNLALTVNGGLLVAIGALAVPATPFLIAWMTTLLTAGALAFDQDSPGYLLAIALLGSMGATLRYLRLHALKETLRSRLLERSLDQQAAEVARLQGLADMAAGIAHHGNNRLVGIVGSASLLLERIEPEDPLWPEVKRIEKAGRELSELIAPLERYAALRGAPDETLRIARPTRPEQLVDVPRLRAQLPPDTDLVLELEADLPIIKVDVDWLHTGLLELVKNAAEALAASQAPSPCVHIRVFRSPDARTLIISVIDEGEGLDPDEAWHLTTPFTTSREPGRKGLGLAVALSAAHLHDGELSFRRIGGATHVSFELPIQLGAPRTTSAAQEPANPSAID